MIPRNPVWLIALLGAGLLTLAACGSASDDGYYPHKAKAGSAGSGGSVGKADEPGSGGLAGSTLGQPPTQGGPEACDGLDNDLDGQVDEGCTCAVGATQSCYLGPPSTRGVGACKDGTQQCIAAAEFGVWGPCTGSVLPSVDLKDGVDNDCNGTPDDGKACGPDQPKEPEQCGNGVDDDCDGLADCADPDCPPCFETSCNDGQDNDSDGKTDCLDPDCPPCTERCDDGVDNDADGLVDCSDPECKTAPNCGTEICGDGKDNDGDGLVDCKDPQCKTAPNCGTEICGDWKDNDGDGLVDCLDPDCAPCIEQNCADGIDNDSDGLVDCKDPDCPCKEICNNGKDDDQDGAIDCKDPECASATNCQQVCGPNGECCNGKDDNGDGRIDEGNVCDTVNEPCPPGAYKSCDCYCGVHRKCRADGTWGPCIVDGNGSCQVAQVTSQSQCGWGYCDYGKCVMGGLWGNQCVHHSDCPKPFVCDLGLCVPDGYVPCP